jgi:hypothetical protein
MPGGAHQNGCGCLTVAVGQGIMHSTFFFLDNYKTLFYIFNSSFSFF